MGQDTSLNRFNSSDKAGRPSFAATQRDKILELLRQAGPRGVSREDLIFRYRWTQAGARIFELEQMGFVIRHDSRPGQRFVVYVLISEPIELKPLPSGSDWYEQQTGKPRPSSHPWKKPFSPKRMADPDCLQLVLPGVTP